MKNSKKFKPTVYNIGYIGEGEYKTSYNYKHTSEYSAWQRMMSRCYSENKHIRFPSYIGCEVEKEWHNFQNFAKWYKENYIDGFQLDKDILVKNNKIYSSETCCFVPNEINSCFINCRSVRGELPIGVTYNRGAKRYVTRLRKNNKRIYIGTYDTKEEAFKAFKYEKEEYAKQLADKYKNKITHKTYQALINYKIEITD